MKKKSKIIAVLMVIIILATLFLSYNFILENTHHNCKGENCPICIQLEKAIQIISSFKWMPAISFVLLILWVFLKMCLSVEQNIYIKKTLVSLNVELLN